MAATISLVVARLRGILDQPNRFAALEMTRVSTIQNLHYTTREGEPHADAAIDKEVLSSC